MFRLPMLNRSEIASFHSEVRITQRHCETLEEANEFLKREFDLYATQLQAFASLVDCTRHIASGSIVK